MPAPPVPFYMTAPQRFTPVFQTSNADGVIGNGVFSGAFMLIGHLMKLWLALTWGATTAGTGAILLSDAAGVRKALPPNWTGFNLDTDNMPLSSGVPTVAGGSCVQTLAGVTTVQPCGILVVSPSGVILPSIPALIAPADSLVINLDIPLLEPGMPR